MTLELAPTIAIGTKSFSGSWTKVSLISGAIRCDGLFENSSV